MTTTLDQQTIPRGFRFAAGTAGIKASGRPDVAIIEAPLGANAAAMFTRNRVAAAPVVVGRNHLAAARGKLRAIVVNAGNANCATRTGDDVALSTSRAAAEPARSLSS